MEGERIPIKVTKVTSNDAWPLIYLPKEAVTRLGLRKGRRVILYIEGDELIVQPVEEVSGDG